MGESKCKDLADQLIILYRNLYDLSKQQQLILTGQLKEDIENILSKRNELFAQIEKLQAEFLITEAEFVSQSDQKDHKIVEELAGYRTAMRAEIERIQTSDQYIQVIAEERKRQIIDLIQLVSRTQNAEIQYKKSSQKKMHGYLYPDQARFFDDRK